jgi:hypothetical protein
MRGKHRAKRRSALLNVLAVIAVLFASFAIAAVTFLAMIYAGLWWIGR